MIDSDSDASPRVPQKKKDGNGILPDHKHQVKKTLEKKWTQCYLIICKKYGIPDQNYSSHSSEKCFGKRFDQEYIKEDLGGKLLNRDKAVNSFQKSEKN